jgi:hypothetical protein
MNIYVDSTGTINLVFTDFAGTPAAPSAVVLTIYDSLGALKTTKGLTDLSQDAPPVTGHYHYHHDIAAADVKGVWRIECKGTVDTFDEVSVITWNIMATGIQWVSAGEVKQYALVRWDTLNYGPQGTFIPFANEYEFDTFLDRFLIPRAQEHINAYCKRDFNTDYTGSTIPEAIRDICARAASNMIQYLVMNKSGPLIQLSGYKVSIPTQDVITPELAKLLDPWVKLGARVVKSTSYQTDEIRDRWGE